MKNIISLCFMVILVGSLSSCGLFDAFRCVSGYSRPNIGALRSELTQQKQVWTGKNLKSYAYTMQYLGEVSPNFPLRVTVTNGSVVSVVPAPFPNQPVTGWTEPTDKTGYLMERQFTSLETSLNGAETQTCGTFSAEYDATYGFPKTSSGGRAEQNLADSIGGLRIFDFTTTP
jgi:Family of unknown function (DUF6174)